jgi:hypothetical protein
MGDTSIATVGTFRFTAWFRCRELDASTDAGFPIEPSPALRMAARGILIASF